VALINEETSGRLLGNYSKVSFKMKSRRRHRLKNLGGQTVGGERKLRERGFDDVFFINQKVFGGGKGRGCTNNEFHNLDD